MNGSPAAGSRGARALLLGALVLLLGLGVALRLRFLDEGTLFIDEAESSLNALSILERGYPADQYLGLPMFENTLTEPWPGNAEYEFRDTSYSSRGMAIYHGWLPLYAIAASLALHGIRPDVPLDPPRVQHDDADILRRIHAVRLPSVWFGALFLLAIFLAGRALYGVDAGLAAMLAATLAPKCIWLSQQARYYSAALALSTLAAWCAWRVYERGRWRDFALAALSFVALFHTSSLSFAILGLACLVLVPRVLGHERARAKLALAAGVVALGLLPWMLWSGYFEHRGRVPMARTLLSFPRDYMVYLGDRPGRGVAGVLLCAALALLWSLRARLAPRLARPLECAGMPALFLTAWILAAYFGFQLFVPAASCSMARLSHNLIAGPILLGALGLAALGRVLWPARSSVVALGATLVLLFSTRNLWRWQRHNPYEAEAAFQMVEHLRGLELTRDTRLYALPYQHFCLLFYTGLPIQSIAPVRREFLTSYPGEIVILETTNRLPQPPWWRVRDCALAQGVALDDHQACDWVPVLHTQMIRAEVQPLVRRFVPEPDVMPAWVAPVVAELTHLAAQPGPGYIDYAEDNPAMFRDYPPLTIDEFWTVFFYRFVDPEARSGAHLNYAERMRSAEARLLPSTWIVLRCPPLSEVQR